MADTTRSDSMAPRDVSRGGTEDHIDVDPQDVVMEDADGEPDEEAQEEVQDAPQANRLTTDDLNIMRGIVDYLTNYKDSNGYETAGLFQRMLNKRLIPDYFDVIKEPTAFSTVRGKLLKKLYKSWSEFVRDFALISHNAQVYNRPSAPVYADAIALRELFKLELAKLVDKNIITEKDAELPDLGEIPPVEDSPPPGPEDEEVEEEDDEEEDDEEEDESDEDRPRRKSGARRGRPPIKREGSKATDAKEDPDSHKVRGRPPKVHTPMEARINTLLKGLRKFKHSSGELKILPFEKLPDKQVLPDYYQEIKNPIALDLIKRKAKRKKYQSVDAALKDLELMFENAKAYNEDASQVYKDAVDLQKEARLLAEQEKKKPDSDFVDEDGRLPLSEILHNGELWKVGDWVHITNPNDITKPIVAQIYRTWQDPEGQKWVNACWYYRPEQTVHRYEKHFFVNEVVKTGRYQDHHVDEIVDRCFVMFVTRYNKGRPRGFPTDKEVYVCEARYNEEKFKLNKIKTWASCVPDEVREKDYEMDMFESARKMKKVESPIKHLLRDDAKEDDPLPKPTWGAPNAPPIVGAVHRRPREANESPPPEPTPSPPPPAALERQSTSSRPYDSQGDTTMGNTSARPSTSSSQQPQNSYGQQFGSSRVSASPAPPLQHHSSYGSQAGPQQTPVPQTPSYTPQPASYGATYPTAVPPTQTPNPLAGGFNSTAHSQNHSTPSRDWHSGSATNVQSQHRPPPNPTPYASSANAYNPPKHSVEVYHLADTANFAIPADVREQFQTDEHGRVLFFSKPPQDVDQIPKETKQLNHSLRYRAAKIRENLEKKTKTKAASENNTATTTEDGGVDPHTGKRRKYEHIDDNNPQGLLSAALELWTRQLDANTEALYKADWGEHWREKMDEDRQRRERKQAEVRENEEASARAKKAREQAKLIKYPSSTTFYGGDYYL